MNLVDRILSMAARTIGVATSEVPGATRLQASKACDKLAAKGRLHRAVLGPKSVRFFTSVLMRDQFVIALNTAKAEADAAKSSDDGFRPGWTADTPVIVPAGVRVQRCPSYEARFQSTPRVLPGIVSFGLQRGRVTVADVEATLELRERIPVAYVRAWDRPQKRQVRDIAIRHGLERLLPRP